MKSADHYLDFYATAESFHDYIKCPVLYMYANPPSYGERAFKASIELISNLKITTKNNLDIVEFDGTHHFHMIEPEKTSKHILEFLKKN